MHVSPPTGPAQQDTREGAAKTHVVSHSTHALPLCLYARTEPPATQAGLGTQQLSHTCEVFRGVMPQEHLRLKIAPRGDPSGQSGKVHGLHAVVAVKVAKCTHRVADWLPEHCTSVKEAPARLEAVAQPPLVRQDVDVVLIEVRIGVHLVLQTQGSSGIRPRFVREIGESGRAREVSVAADAENNTVAPHPPGYHRVKVRSGAAAPRSVAARSCRFPRRAPRRPRRPRTGPSHSIRGEGPFCSRGERIR